MSVLNQSGEEQVECPLCMEPLEVDDLTFYPCTCGYQICRFCWHRIRTDENGLCPACRKAYSENPADFTPLSKEQVAQLKAEKRQRDQQRKAKLSESRKHLASVRVVQKNLVFVVGLPMRLADAEILKKHEYFGKFGKIHKVVINQSTSYAGSQGPSASAYVTYVKSEDALRAIQNVNNITLDGRLIKSSLGTTKYCSHFMKNQTCPKPDCMYLHDFGDPEASFTKEQMHAGKHQEYEKKLHDALLNKTTTANVTETKPSAKCKDNSSTTPTITTTASTTANANSIKESWPQLTEKLDKTERKLMDKTLMDKKTDQKQMEQSNSKDKTQKKTKTKSTDIINKKIDSKKGNSELCCQIGNSQNSPDTSSNSSSLSSSSISDVSSKLDEISHSTVKSKSEPSNDLKLPLLDDNSSFFSQNTFQKLQHDNDPHHNHNHIDDDHHPLSHTSQILNDSLPDINSSEDWEAAFGFSKFGNHLEELAKQGNSLKNHVLDRFSDNFVGGGGISNTRSEHNNYSKYNHLGYQNGYEMKDSLLEVLNKNDYPYYDRLSYMSSVPPPQHKELNGLNGLNGTSDHLSKFFESYKNGQKDYFELNGMSSQQQNGLVTNALHQNQHLQLNINQSNLMQHNLSQSGNILQNPINQLNNHQNVNQFDKQAFMVLRQMQLEQQLLNLNLNKPNYGQQHQQQQHMIPNGLSTHSGQFINGDLINSQNYGQRNQIYHNNSLNGKSTRNHAEDELDFDPFQETQKALAELIENEQNHKLHNTSRALDNPTQINGLVHSQSSNHIPPPPPGFVQPNTHMNSFGSKILPYLNMGSSQQQSQQIGLNGTTQNSWPSSYSQLPQNKTAGIGPCNDWKVLDPAIVSSSPHFPLANMTRVHDQYNLPQRSFNDYTSNNSFANFSQQLQQQQPNGFNFLNTQQNLNWLGNELNTQISSPPGFRGAAQATKQQEC